MSFMAVAYVPSFLEDRSTFIKERANGLYGPTAFMLSNFIIGLPYLCMSPLHVLHPNFTDITPSLDSFPLLSHNLFPEQFPAHSHRLLHMDNVALP